MQQAGLQGFTLSLTECNHLRPNARWHNSLLVVMTVCPEAHQYDETADPCNREEHW